MAIFKGKAILAYTAGIIDADGCISIDKQRNSRNKKRGYALRLSVQVGNTKEWLPFWLKMQYGGSVCQHNSSKPEAKDYWNWNISSHKAVEFLKLILPYLQLKRPQAELGILFQKPRNPRRGRLLTDEQAAIEEAQLLLMRQMNQRGRIKEHA